MESTVIRRVLSHPKIESIKLLKYFIYTFRTFCLEHTQVERVCAVASSSHPVTKFLPHMVSIRTGITVGRRWTVFHVSVFLIDPLQYVSLLYSPNLRQMRSVNVKDRHRLC